MTSSRRPGGCTANVRLLTVLLCTGLACARTADDATEPYYAVLEEIERQLDIEPPIAVHPLVGQLERRQNAREYDLTSFYSEDTVRVFNRTPPRYFECRIATSGACELRQGEISVVLSESVELGNDAWMVIAFVTDLRAHVDVQSYYRVDARRNRRGAWAVYRFHRL
ncbi:MAG TPA: hypothetical protein VMM79_13085 [Longimicrobiales bacterium]|nr:hypothetical protein [Longimicrobiales bacterium]